MLMAAQILSWAWTESWVPLIDMQRLGMNKVILLSYLKKCFKARLIWMYELSCKLAIASPEGISVYSPTSIRDLDSPAPLSSPRFNQITSPHATSSPQNRRVMPEPCQVEEEYIFDIDDFVDLNYSPQPSASSGEASVNVQRDFLVSTPAKMDQQPMDMKEPDNYIFVQSGSELMLPRSDSRCVYIPTIRLFLSQETRC